MSQNGCRLLNLPAELRNRIYELVLQDSRNFNIRPWHSNSYKYPALLRTCQQIAGEAGSIFFQQTTFYVAAGDCIWLRALSPRNRSLIRKIRPIFTAAWLAQCKFELVQQMRAEVLHEFNVGITIEVGCWENRILSDLSVGSEYVLRSEPTEEHIKESRRMQR